MSKEKQKPDTGGTAFPEPLDAHGDPGSGSPGMTLLDWFAGQALAEAISYVDRLGARNYDSYIKSNKMVKDASVEDIAAHVAYEQAQAMIKRKRELEGS